MIKFSIQYDDLRYIFSALKSAIPSFQSKPWQEYIRFQCKAGVLTAQSIDGYRLHSVSVPVTARGEDEFEFLLKPFALPKFKLLLPIECELYDKEIQFDFLDHKYIERLGLGVGSWIDTEKAIPTTNPVFKIGFNPKYIAEAAASLNSNNKKVSAMVMEFYGPLSPAKLYDAYHKDNFRLVLPVRLKERNDA